MYYWSTESIAAFIMYTPQGKSSRLEDQGSGLKQELQKKSFTYTVYSGGSVHPFSPRVQASPLSSHFCSIPSLQVWCLSSLFHQTLSSCLAHHHRCLLPPPALLFLLPFPPPLCSFGFSSQTDQRQRERSPRHIRSMVMIGASKSQERKLHGCAHRQQISYFQKPLILISRALISSTEADLKGEPGWQCDGFSLILSSTLCEQYPLNKAFTAVLSLLL